MTTENIVIVIIQASIGLLIVALTASINIKIKFATTENQAKNDAILIFSKILAAVGFFGASSTLLYELYLPEPLTKESIRSILILSFDIIFVVFCMGALVILKLLKENNKNIYELIEEITELLSLTASLKEPKNEEKKKKKSQT